MKATMGASQLSRLYDYLNHEHKNRKLSYQIHLPKQVNIQRVMYALTHLVQQHPILRVAVNAERVGVRQFIPFIEEVKVEKTSQTVDLDDYFNSIMNSETLDFPLFCFKIFSFTDKRIVLLHFSRLIFDESQLCEFVRQFEYNYAHPFSALTHTTTLSLTNDIIQNSDAYFTGHFYQILRETNLYKSQKDQQFSYMPVNHVTKKIAVKQHNFTISEDYKAEVDLIDFYTAVVLANQILGRTDSVVLGVSMSRDMQSLPTQMIAPRSHIHPLQFSMSEVTYIDQLKAQIRNTLSQYKSRDHTHEHAQLIRTLDSSVASLKMETLIHTEPLSAVCNLEGIQCQVEMVRPLDLEADIEFFLNQTGASHINSNVKMAPNDQITMFFNQHQYDSLTIETYGNLIQSLYQQIQENIAQTVGDLSLLVSEADGELIQTLNEQDKLPNSTVVELFETTVERYQDKVALRFGNQSLTYGELNAQANQVAHHLRERGVETNTYVAIMAERSIEMIVGILGIVKSGAAYVPIDADYPEARVQYILNDAKPKVVLLHEVDSAINTGFDTLQIKDLLTGKTTNPSRCNSEDDLVYVIYTSGTTGQPKGTAIMHHSVDRLVKNVDYVPLSAKTSILLSGTIAFDAATFEIYGALLNGGVLTVTTKEDLMNPETLGATIRKEQINTMWLTASLFNQIVSEQVEVLEPLDYLLIGGEALTPKWVDVLNHRPKHPQLINGYGPTESTTFTTTYAIPQALPKRIPIGKPIRQTEVYVMRGQRLCGVGVPGELCIGGRGLAHGYLNRPDLTEERFIDHPFGSGKLYRSGDLVRLQPDGELDYLGRLDKQVKIRGFRIELSEIEHVLSEIKGINKAVVVVREENGDKQLVAFYEGPHKISMSQLKDELKAHMPNYMIPAMIMHIDQIPITANGKLDQRALPEIEHVQSEDYTAPTTDLEATLCQIYEEILHLEQVGIHDNFFELGGHSLKATLVVNRIEQRLHKQIKVRDIMKHPTVAELVNVLETQNLKTYQPLPEVTHADDYYAMSPAQRGMYMIWRQNPSDQVYNIPFLWRLSAALDIEKLQNAVRQLIARHEILRTQMCFHNGSLEQAIHRDDDPDFQVVHTTETDAQSILHQAMAPFDLEKGKLMRVRYIIAPQTHYLFIDTHHSINDGMSNTILLDELNMLYQGKSFTQAPRQYKDYSEWMTHRDFTPHQAFWHSQFEDGVPTLNLPLDHPRAEQSEAVGHMYRYVMDSTLSHRIQQYIRQHDVTEFMFFLSAVMVLLSKYSRQEDIVVGSVMSARTHPDTEKMLGMFANSLVFRGQPTRDKMWTTFLSEMKQLSLEAYEYQDYPFEQLVEDFVTERDATRHPLFDVMLVLQNNESNHADFGHSRLTHIPPMSKTAKFDLSFIIEETEEGYAWNIEYNTGLFETTTIKNMIEQLSAMIDTIISQEDLAVRQLHARTSESQAWVDTYVNHHEMDYPKDASVIARFARQVQRQPEAEALVFGEESYTYIEVWRWAQDIAQKLQSAGVTPGDVVGIMMTRGSEMIVTMLSAAMLHATYLPIDPDYPVERINFMVEDAAVKVVCSNSLDIDVPCEVFDIPKYFEVNEMAPVKLEEAILHEPLAPLYLIYTSGTTGRPKGVSISHQNVLNLVYAWKDEIELEASDRILQYANIVFDASVWEIYSSLIMGHPLIIASEEERLDVQKLERLIHEMGVTVASIPVQVCMLMEDYHLRCLVTGGSTSTPALVEHVRPNVDMYVNAYGPTESTVITTAWRYTSNDPCYKVPIGRPLANIQVYILEDDQLCGVGVPGELCIAGDSLSQGYLNRPELNEASFIDNPFGQGKLYRTGDLARYLASGEIEYLGRLDNQVSLRGYRVELSEIINTINHYPEVRDSEVIMKHHAGEDVLVGYYVASESCDDALRVYLQQYLPYYMIPSYLIRLDDIPLTKNGKVDTTALPDIKLTGHETIAPRNEHEKRIVSVFEEVLNMSPIGIDDDFFMSGGQSLSAMKVVAKLKAYHIQISMQELYQYKTARSLALQLQHHEMPELTLPENITTLNALVRQSDDGNVDYDQSRALGHVLLTGATGFLGAYLLKEVVDACRKISCIVRADDRSRATEKLKENLEVYFEPSHVERMMRKVEVIPGDLTAQLPLDDYCFDTIIHAGARTDHFGEERKFYQINTESTAQLADIALQRQARFVYVSTVSVGGVFESSVTDHTFSEHDLYKSQYLDSPYTRSKFYGELEVLQRVTQGLDAQIIRVGNLVSSAKGMLDMKSLKTNRFSIVMNDLLKLGVIGRSFAHIPVEFSFVNVVARHIHGLVQLKAHPQAIYHIYHPDVLDMQTVLEHSTGRAFNIVEDNEFEDLLLSQQMYEVIGLNSSQSSYLPAQVVSHSTRKLTTALGLDWPKVTDEWLTEWRAWLLSGFAHGGR